MLSERERTLLRPPVKRAAYSDRTAWLMAVFSELAYEPFEPVDSQLQALAEEIAESSDAARIADLLERRMPDLGVEDSEREAAFQKKLDSLGFQLEQVISRAHIHAYLAVREEDEMAVLAFRGTEADYRDILTDLDARFYRKADGSRRHNGFHQAYQLVRDPVRAACKDLAERDLQLYVTGHSLGGALALLATRDLAADHVAACYSFGAPKVGNEDFGHAIKTPVYRVVNAADVVPRVPPRKTIEILYRLAGFLRIGWLARILGQLRGYMHWGDMRYLTRTRRGDHSDVRVIPNPSGLQQWLRAIRRTLDEWNAFVTDHAIARYREKLAAYAEWRNRDSALGRD